MIERQDKIIKTFEAHSLAQSKTDTNTNIVPYIPNSSQKIVEDEKVYEEMKSLLDLEFNKIQNEFEALEIWAGVLTVIFLIFSFYSLFKTEQMEQQSKTALRLINDTQSKSDGLLKKMEEEREKKIKAIEDSFKSWANTKEKAIRKMLDDKSNKYQKQLMKNYKAEFEKKIEEIRNHLNKMSQESISSSERKMGDEVQKFIEEWNTKMDQMMTSLELIRDAVESSRCRLSALLSSAMSYLVSVAENAQDMQSVPMRRLRNDLRTITNIVQDTKAATVNYSALASLATRGSVLMKYKEKSMNSEVTIRLFIALKDSLI